MPDTARPYRQAGGRPVTDEPAPAPPPSRYPWWSLTNRVRPARKRRGLPLREHLQGIGAGCGIIALVWLILQSFGLDALKTMVNWLPNGTGLVVLLLVVVIIILAVMLYRSRPRH